MTIKREVRAALESAQTVDLPQHRKTPHKFGLVRSLVLAVVRELPDMMTMAELRDELEISNVQDRGDND
jgi:hypothetical protein